MVAHPPMLYMGYVGFSVAFAFAISALIGGKLDATWARWSRPWTTVRGCFSPAESLWEVSGRITSWAGRLVVLGPGRERFVHALAGGHGSDSFAGGDRKARRVQELDRAFGDYRVFFESAGNISRAIWCC